MSSHNPPVDGESTQLYELFEEALELLARGASYDAVLAKCPLQQREELRKNVACAAFVQATAPAMARPRNLEQRAAKREDFLKAVRELNGASNSRSRQSASSRSWLDEFAESVQSLLQQVGDAVGQLASPQRAPRFAPMLAALALFLMVGAGIGTAAASALPGDVTYPVKEIARDVRESFASGPAKEKLIAEHENARREDNQQAAVDRQKTITVTQDLRFYQKGDSIWDIGGQSVLPGYLDPSGGVVPMQLDGDPKDGDLVRLTYMIVPGKPNLVYGVRLEVIPPASSTPTPTAQPTPTSEVTLCEPTPPVGWVVYRIRRNDTLGGLSVNVSKSVAEIKQVNCRTSDTIVVGGTLYLPAVPGVTILSPEPVIVLATPTAVVPIIIVPEITATPVTPVGETPATAVVEITATSETEPTAVEATPTPVAVDATPLPEATVQPTTEAGAETETPAAETPTSVATEEGVATEESTVTGTPAATVVETPAFETPATEVPATEAAATETVASEATEANPTAEPATTFPTVTPTPIAVEVATAVPAEPTIPVDAEPVDGAGEPEATSVATVAQPTVVVPTPEPPPATVAPTVAPTIAEVATAVPSNGESGSATTTP